MKKVKLIIILVFCIGGFIAIAQAVKQDINSSIGNGKAMENNLNEPNATSPATQNIQNYEKDGTVLEMNNHPENDLGNSYNRSTYEGKK